MRASKSVAVTFMLFYKKSDEILQFCLEYQGSNTLTIKNCYLLPLISEFFEQLSLGRCFTKLNLTSAYHQMEIREKYKQKMDFKTRYDYFECKVICFRLSHTLASFQKFIYKILAKKLDIFIIINFEDIFIYTKDQSQSYIDIAC